MTPRRNSRTLVRDRRTQFLIQAVGLATVLHVVISTVCVIMAPYWPDSFRGAISGQLPGLTDIFAHTPRVEALLAGQDEDGYLPETRETRRLGYAVSHLLIALTLFAILAGFAIFLMRGIRDSSRSPLAGVLRTNSTPVLLLVEVACVLGFGLIAAGAASLLYFGFMANAGHPRRDPFIPLVFLIDMNFMALLATFAAMLHRALVRPTA